MDFFEFNLRKLFLYSRHVKLLKQEKSMENDVYGYMRCMAESYKERTNRSFWEDLRSEVSRSDCPSWIKRCFEGKEVMA